MSLEIMWQEEDVATSVALLRAAGASDAEVAAFHVGYNLARSHASRLAETAHTIGECRRALRGDGT